jgi:hypothetical protein
MSSVPRKRSPLPNCGSGQRPRRQSLTRAAAVTRVVVIDRGADRLAAAVAFGKGTAVDERPDANPRLDRHERVTALKLVVDHRAASLQLEPRRGVLADHLLAPRVRHLPHPIADAQAADRVAEGIHQRPGGRATAVALDALEHPPRMEGRPTAALPASRVPRTAARSSGSSIGLHYRRQTGDAFDGGTLDARAPLTTPSAACSASASGRWRTAPRIRWATATASRRC